MRLLQPVDSYSQMTPQPTHLPGRMNEQGQLHGAATALRDREPSPQPMESQAPPNITLYEQSPGSTKKKDNFMKN